MDHHVASLVRRASSGGVLLVYRRNGSGRWGLPGGAVRAGESPHAAQRRTLASQTGHTTAGRDVLVVDFRLPVPGSLPQVLTLVWDAGFVTDEAAARPVLDVLVPDEIVDRRFVLPGQILDFTSREEAGRIHAALAAVAEPAAPRYCYHGMPRDFEETVESL